MLHRAVSPTAPCKGRCCFQNLETPLSGSLPQLSEHSLGWGFVSRALWAACLSLRTGAGTLSGASDSVHGTAQWFPFSLRPHPCTCRLPTFPFTYPAASQAQGLLFLKNSEASPDDGIFQAFWNLTPEEQNKVNHSDKQNQKWGQCVEYGSDCGIHFL